MTRVGPGGPAKKLAVPSREDLRVSVWFLPGAVAAAALISGLLLSLYRPAAGSGLAGLLWPGGRDAASATLTALVGSVVTVTSLTFSLVVVALQLASQQFSPRLLREFARDRLTQAVLAVLFGTFVFALTVLRGLDPQRPLPVLALAVAFALGVVSVFALIGFLGHIIRTLRVDSMMTAVHRATRDVIAGTPPAHDERASASSLLVESPRVVLSASSGFVQTVDVGGLACAVEEVAGTVELIARPGDQILEGTPVGFVASSDPHELDDQVRAAVIIGHERTLEQDAAFGFRQLVDIAVKALSPGVNDPETAAHAISHLADLLARIVRRHVGPRLHADAQGRPCLLVAGRTLEYYFEQSFGQIRRYGAREPVIAVAILRALRDVAAATDLEGLHEIVRGQVRGVRAELPEQLLPPDRVLVERAAETVEQALAGDARGAYSDPSGRLRST